MGGTITRLDEITTLFRRQFVLRTLHRLSYARCMAVFLYYGHENRYKEALWIDAMMSYGCSIRSVYSLVSNQASMYLLPVLKLLRSILTKGLECLPGCYHQLFIGIFKRSFEIHDSVPSKCTVISYLKFAHAGSYVLTTGPPQVNVN